MLLIYKGLEKEFLDGFKNLKIDPSNILYIPIVEAAQLNFKEERSKKRFIRILINKLHCYRSLPILPSWSYIFNTSYLKGYTYKEKIYRRKVHLYLNRYFKNTKWNMPDNIPCGFSTLLDVFLNPPQYDSLQSINNNKKFFHMLLAKFSSIIYILYRNLKNRFASIDKDIILNEDSIYNLKVSKFEFGFLYALKNFKYFLLDEGMNSLFNTFYITPFKTYIYSFFGSVDLFIKVYIACRTIYYNKDELASVSFWNSLNEFLINCKKFNIIINDNNIIEFIYSIMATKYQLPIEYFKYRFYDKLSCIKEF